ncbi:hypothetical protein EXU57_03275 [Segetibacter sp. 3557_3]|uniref:hypothetical protein n=1 Tax=Segetibacter sp. 3557_3 TaxID=2547429 RepID=UPI001058600E|nr:hypothetical protein [Segetibacter sp. 3557_3]TDH29101.1 hypothetical protein EXU57_03275 [Segetibacter sp. 3557_3]
MKKMLLSLCTMMVLSGTIMGQKAAKVVYAELGGPGLASINYDMRFAKREDGFGFRAGVGGFSIDNTSILLVPLGVNYIVSKDKRNYFETGAGVTFVSANENDPFYSDDSRFRGTFGHLNIGYRLQPADGGFFFRAAVNPIFGNNGFFPFYGGIAFGYKF